MQLASLLDDRMMEERATEERKLREAVAANPKLKDKAGAWDEIARAEAKSREILVPFGLIEGAAGFNSELFAYARVLVRAADERARPNAERLREYTDGALPQIQQFLAAETPVYPELEQVRLSFSLERMREYLGPDHAIVKKALGTKSPDETAKSADFRLEARGPQSSDGALRGRPGGGKGEHGPDDCAGARHRRRCAGAAEDRRDGGGRTRRARAAGDRGGALRGLRHESLSGCDVHASSVRWRGGWLDGSRQARRTLHLPRAFVRTRHRRAAIRAAEVVARCKTAARS